MAEPTTVKTLRDGSLVITDATPVTPKSYTVAYETGDVSFSYPKADRVVIRDRHTIAGLRQGAAPIVTGSFSVHMRAFTDATETIIDVIEKTNGWSAAVSTGSTGQEQYLLDLAFTVNGTGMGDTANHVITFPKCHLEWSFSEGDPSTVSVTFECYGTVTRTGQV